VCFIAGGGTMQYDEQYSEYDPRDDPHMMEHHEPERMSLRRNPSGSDYMLPDRVREFIVYFHMKLQEKNLYEISRIYEETWPMLTEQYFKEDPWPSAESISGLVDGNPLFITLYRELYFRHIYGKLTPTLQQRHDSYENYCDLFNYIVHNNDNPAPVELELPNKWLWDIIDEFIYQFESFAQYRVRLQNKSPEEIAKLKGNPRLWNVHIVLNVLHSLIEKSMINEQLEAYKRSEDPDDFAGDYGSLPLYKMLGYFSLVALLRLHCLLGDYYQALRVMENIELDKKGLYSRVPACRITIFYYVGFCYLMMGRYEDTVRTFSSILYYITRTQTQKAAGGGYNVITKKRDQLYNLLAIATTLCPSRIDETVQAALLDKYGEKMARMQKGELSVFRDMFHYGSPKFLAPTAPDYDSLTDDHSTESYRLQQKIFEADVKETLKLPVIRSYLKLYSTMPIEKLAAFLALSADDFRIHLHQYKQKSKQLVSVKGTALDGVRMSSVDVDFYLDNDMIHIADVKISKNFGQYFVHSIHKMLSSGV